MTNFLLRAVKENVLPQFAETEECPIPTATHFFKIYYALTKQHGVTSQKAVFCKPDVV